MACKSEMLIATTGLGSLAAPSTSLFPWVLLFRRGFAPLAEDSGWPVADASAGASPGDAFVFQRLYDILDNLWRDRVVQVVVIFLALINRGQRLPWGMKAIRNVSGTWIGVTGMINIKGAADLAKRATNCIVIAITNYYQTVGGQGPLFIYKISTLRQDAQMSYKQPMLQR